MEALVPCLRPIQGWRAPGGQVVFNRGKGWVDRPVTVGCGRCQGCRRGRAQEWAARCCHEAQMHNGKACFLTLTYSPETIPHGWHLEHEDFRLFARQLRRKAGKFRYLMCGEYGDTTHRPHFHAAIFGQDFTADRTLWKYSNGNILYRSALLEKCWTKGHALIGELSYESARYVASYILKKHGGKAANEKYSIRDADDPTLFHVRRQPYATMSLKPGLGLSWIKKYWKEVYPDDALHINGNTIRPPRYYDEWLERNEPEVFAAVRGRRMSDADTHAQHRTPDRLRARDQIAERKLRQQDREA